MRVVKAFLLLLMTLVTIFSGENVMAFTLKSPAFNNGGAIPTKYTCDGDNVSPPLHWEGIPAGTKSFALIMDDPDAPSGVWDHWILFNMPANTTELSEAVKTLPVGTQVGINSWHHTKYDGPCPPNSEHRYIFKLYALDSVLNLQTGATKSSILAAIKMHHLEMAEYMGRYNRAKR